MKVFLIGFMGCGKTTLGQKLASKLNYPFIDLDKLIEAETGTSIVKYFDEFGETAFRELERKTLQSHSFPQKCIIATGGGAPCFFDNMDWMNQNGVTVYLSLSPLALAGRLEKGKKERPLIRDFNPEELVAFIEKRLEDREVFYNKAKIIVKGIDITPEKITEALNSYLK